MKIEMRTIGPFQANAFVVMCEATSEAAIIDTGDSGEGLVEAAEEIGAKVTRILLTHGHIDHVGGAAKLHRAYPEAPLFLHPKGKPLADSVQRQGIMFGLQVEPVPPIDEALAGGQTIEIGTTIRLHVIETPGHSPGSVTFYEPHE
ncbi:MAG: MBL fold metallo-hydrolase, partial [Planctomycetota bacterium]